MLFSGQIRAARGFLKMSQVELAELTELSLVTIQRLEGDDNLLEKANNQTIKKIKNILEDRGIKFLESEKGDTISGIGVRYFVVETIKSSTKKK